MTKICPHCGHENKDIATFCGNCGNKLVSQDIENNGTVNSPSINLNEGSSSSTNTTFNPSSSTNTTFNPSSSTNTTSNPTSSTNAASSDNGVLCCVGIIILFIILLLMSKG